MEKLTNTNGDLAPTEVKKPVMSGNFMAESQPKAVMMDSPHPSKVKIDLEEENGIHENPSMSTITTEFNSVPDEQSSKILMNGFLEEEKEVK